MKIGVVCHSSYGGSARIAIDSALELSRRGHTVHLFSRIPPYLLPTAGYEMSCHTLYTHNDDRGHAAHLRTDWPRDELEGMAAQIIAVCEEEGLDILHIHYALPFIFIARSVKQKLGEKSPPVILTLHGTDVMGLSRENAETQALLTSPYCDALTTVSVNHAELFHQLFPRDALPEIIPNFTDLSRFSRKRPSVTGPRPVVLHISNFRPVKDPCGVVHIFSKLRTSLEAELWFVGDGEEMKKVKALVGKEGLTGDVRFFGLLPDISRVVNGADLLIMSSTYESFCLTALEAMACGVPVLAPHVGGIPEVVRDGRTGFLYPPGDYPAAAAFAVSLLSKPGLYARMSKDAAHRAQDFDQEQVITLYERLYSDVMAKTPSIEKMAPIAEEVTINGVNR